MKLSLYVLKIFSSQFFSKTKQNSQIESNSENNHNMSNIYPNESANRSYEHIDTHSQYPMATFFDPQQQLSSLNSNAGEYFDQNLHFQNTFFDNRMNFSRNHEINYHLVTNNVSDSGMHGLSSNQIDYPMFNYQHNENQAQSCLQVNNREDKLNLSSSDRISSTFDSTDLNHMNKVFREVEKILPEDVMNDLVNESTEVEGNNLYQNEIPQNITENNFIPGQSSCLNTKEIFSPSYGGNLFCYPNLQPFPTSQAHGSQSLRYETALIGNREILNEDSLKFGEMRENISTSVQLQKINFSKCMHKDVEKLELDFLTFVETRNAIEILAWIFKSIKKRIRFNLLSSYNYTKILDFHIDRINKINFHNFFLQTKDFYEADEYCDVFLDFLKNFDVSAQHKYTFKENEFSSITNYLYTKCTKKKDSNNLSLQMNVCFCILSRLEEILFSLNTKEIKEEDLYMLIMQEITLVNKKYDILPELYSIEILIYNVFFFKRKSLLILVLLKTIKKMVEENWSQNYNYVKTCKDIIFLILIKKLHLKRKNFQPDDMRDTVRNMCILSYNLVSNDSRAILASKIKQQSKDLYSSLQTSKSILVDLFCLLQHLLVIEICNYKQLTCKYEIHNCFSLLSQELVIYKLNIKNASNFDLLWINQKLYEFIVAKNFLELFRLEKFNY